MAKTPRENPAKRIKAYRDLATLANHRNRNVIRGILNSKKKLNTPLHHVNVIRQNIDASDLAAATELLLGPQGLYPTNYVPMDYRSLQNIHSLSAISPECEIAFICGHLNAWADKCLDLLVDMRNLGNIGAISAEDQLAQLQAFWKKWGISDFLNRKLVYYMNLAEVDKIVVTEYQKFAKILDIESAPEPYFSAMELMSERYQYFRSIKTWINILAKYPTNDFRQHNALHNVLPVPLSEKDAAAYLRKSHSMSVADELCAIKILLSLKAEWPHFSRRINSTLKTEILQGLKKLENPNFEIASIIESSAQEDKAFLLYRRSLAFLEQEAIVENRYKVDINLGWRLLPSRYGLRFEHRKHIVEQEYLKNLLLSDEDKEASDYLQPSAGTMSLFARTLIFLRYISVFPKSLRFTEEEIRFIFENTTSLQYLMTEPELNSIYNLSSEDGKIIISTLALALYKEKEHDEDIDFKFRFILQQTIRQNFDGSIVKFIKSLSERTPGIAQFLASTLDRQTIQKLYGLVDSADHADQIRQDILRHLGEKFSSLDYLIEADRIRAHNQIAKLKTEIDDSRVYVDGIALKKWVRENPNAYIKEYRRLIEHSIETLSRSAILISESNISLVKAEISVIGSFDYILTKAMDTIFVQFCINPLFGIDSYLGRRIRHNTLHGMMLGGVDSIIDDYPALFTDRDYFEIYSKWLDLYKNMIDHLRLELLQFKSDTKRQGLFRASFDPKNPSTINNIVELRKIVMFSGIMDNFEDAVLKFCWDEFEPQLKFVQRYLSTDMRSKAVKDIDNVFGIGATPESRKFLTALRDSVHERFQTLSSWFQVPEDRTLSATIQQISDLITVESERAIERALPRVVWEGEGAGLTIKGSSVHRVYDCLYVLIFNAYKYGKQAGPVRARVKQTVGANSIVLTVDITSDFADDGSRLEQMQRIRDVVDQAANLSNAMLKEGYSGIRKLLYLTSEGQPQHTVSYAFTNETLTIGFRTAVEVEDAVIADIAG